MNKKKQYYKNKAFYASAAASSVVLVTLVCASHALRLGRRSCDGLGFFHAVVLRVGEDFFGELLDLVLDLLKLGLGVSGVGFLGGFRHV